jgi:sulfur transfer complex TusBCD TusB component (DsrH family)
MKILYIVRSQPDDLVKETIEKQSAEHEINIVLIQDAVRMEESLPGHMFALEDDLQKRSLSRNIPAIGYNELLELIFQNDRVLCW